MNESYVSMSIFKFNFFLIFTFVPFFSFFLPHDLSMESLGFGKSVFTLIEHSDAKKEITKAFYSYMKKTEYMDDR
jgi:hypothetical protein